MKKFSYVAKDLNGKKIKGTFIAQSEVDVRENLAKNDLYLVKIKKYSTSQSSFFSLTGKVGISELASFSKQFSALISAGIPIIESLKTLKEQPYSNLLKGTLDKVIEDVYGGQMLSESMQKYPKIFPKFFSSMVYVGESSGKLSEVLISVANYYSRSKKHKNKLHSALAYPIVLFLMMIGVMIVMFHFVIPTFISSLSKMDIEMPSITMAMFNISKFLSANWQNIALAIIIVAGIIYLLNKTQNGMYFFDMCKVKLPIVRKIKMAIFTSQFVQCLGLLLGSGLDIISSLESIKTIINNKYLERQFDRVILDVRKGMPLSNAIEVEMKLSSVVTQMIAVGEKTGQTDKMLLQTTDYFDQEVDKALNLISSIIQPLLLVLLGTFIAVVFIAIYTPILSMITSLEV